MVLARGTSSPVSTMLVASRTSAPPEAKRTSASSTSAGGMSPCATSSDRSGTSPAIRSRMGAMSSMRGQTTKLWPPRRDSRLSAWVSSASSIGARAVRMGWRRAGGVAMTLSDCSPTSAACRVRGMGVAVRVRTWTPSPSLRKAAFCRVPKRCSSSITTRPRSRKRTPLAASAWVPMAICTSPAASARLVSLFSAGGVRRDSEAIRRPKPAKRLRKVSRCWRASTVVGASTATCLPESAAAAVARSATSVLPKPTSPQASRSIGRPEARSRKVSAMALAWSGVSGKGKRSAKRA